MSKRGDTIRAAGGLLKRNNKLGIGRGNGRAPVGGDEGEIRVRMVNSQARLYAKAGGKWYNTPLYSTPVLAITEDPVSGAAKFGNPVDVKSFLKITGYRGMIDFQGGQDNIIIGNSTKKPLETLVNASTNDDNLCVGDYSMNATFNGRQNIAVGAEAMRYIGRNSSEPFGDNSYNIAMGYNALKGRDDGTRTQATRNVALGFMAMASCHHADSASSTTYNNVSIGAWSGYYMSGYSNVMIGDSAGFGAATSTGYANVGIGYLALNDYTTGYYNVAIGGESLQRATEGFSNVGIGWRALEDVTDADYNVGIGHLAGQNVTGGNNVCVGVGAGDTITSGANNTMLGYATDGHATTSNQLAVGYTAVTTGQYGIAIGINISAASDRFVFGRASNTMTNDFTTNNTWTQSSDERKKRNIQDDTLGLSFINDLKPRTFKWKPAEEHPEEWHAWDDLYDIVTSEEGLPEKVYTGAIKYHEMNTDAVMHGLIAQEVKSALDNAGIDTFSGWEQNENGEQYLASGMFVYPLIKAVQELSSEVQELSNKVAVLEAA